MKGTVTATLLNVRPTPGGTPILMSLKYGDIVETNNITEGWWKLTKITRNGRDFPLPAATCYAYEGLTEKYIRAEVPAPEPPPPSATGIRAYIYRNHEKRDTANWGPNHPPIPDTRNIYGPTSINNGRVEYTSRLQYFLYSNLKMRVPYMTIEDFDKDFRYWCNDKLAFFNGAGSNTRRVYPLNLNKGRPNMLNNQLLFGGWTVSLLSDQPSDVLRDGVLRLPLACIDAFDKNLEDYDSVSHPELWVRPSITYGPDVARQEPFSTFHGFGRMPIISNHTKVVWIEAAKVRILGKDEPTPAQFTKDWAS